MLQQTREPRQKQLFNLPSKEGETWGRLEECPRYYVSDQGRVWGDRLTGCKQGNYPAGLISQSFQGTGYLQVGIRTKGGTYRKLVHRLVMKVHGGPPPTENHNRVNHIDRNKTNNRIDNLEWATPLENNVHGMFLKMVDQVGEEEAMSKIQEWMSCQE